MTGSNRRHPPCKGGALPAELIALGRPLPYLHTEERPSTVSRLWIWGKDATKVTPTYHAAFSGNRRNVPLARNAIASFARICGFSHDEVEDIRLASGEALNNAVEHGHANRP